jgi:hypothetical protein
MLPEQVRKQIERANALIDQQTGPTPTGEPSNPPAPAPNPEPPAPAPAPAVDASAPAPAPAPAAPAPATQDDPNSDTWRQKYLTLQGVINAESRRYQGELQQRDDRLRALEAELATLKAAPAPATAAPGPRQFSQDEVDRFGPELLHLIADKAESMANEIVTRKLAEFKPAIQQVRDEVQAVGRTVYESKEQEFWGELAKSVPEFQAINVMPEWLMWLGQEDDVSGFPRQAILEGAQKRLDHQRVAKLFDAFKKDAGLAKPATPPAPASAPAPAAHPVSPSPRTVGTGGSGPTPREPEAPSVKRSEIAAHYRKSSMDPTYRTTPEYSAMEQRIMQAQAANRVLNA